MLKWFRVFRASPWSFAIVRPFLCPVPAGRHRKRKFEKLPSATASKPAVVPVITGKLPGSFECPEGFMGFSQSTVARFR